MPCKAAVPANLGDLMLGGHGCQLGAVEGLEETPDIVHRAEEQDICVHIQKRVDVLQDDLRQQQGDVQGHCASELIRPLVHFFVAHYAHCVQTREVRTFRQGTAVSKTKRWTAAHVNLH